MTTRSTTYALVVLQLCTSVLLQRDRGPPIDVSPTDRQFRVVYEWRTIDFAFRSEQERSAAIFRGEYIPKNVILSDVKPYANRLYVVRYFRSLSKQNSSHEPCVRRCRVCCPAHLRL